MLSKLIHFLFMAGGSAAGYEVYRIFQRIGYFDSTPDGAQFLLVGMIVLGAVLGLLIAPVLVGLFSWLSRRSIATL